MSPSGSTRAAIGRLGISAARVICWLSVVGVSGCLLFSSHDGDWPCHTDDDCEDGLLCTPELYSPKRTCKSTWPCTSASCPPDRSCQEGNCVTKQCIPGDFACGEYGCDASTFRCFTSCSDFRECASTNKCVDGVCMAGDCVGQGQCAGFRCEGNACRTSCVDGAQCDDGWMCEAGACRPGRCEGTPTGCSDLGMSACTSSVKCTYRASCNGIGNACAGAGSELSCVSIKGCSWDKVSKACSGATVCSDITSQTACPGFVCSWGEACSWTPQFCQSLKIEKACRAVPGCAFVPL